MDGAVRLPVEGIGSRGVDRDVGQGAGGGPITPRDGDGNTQRVGGVIDGKSSSNKWGGACDSEPEHNVYGGGAGPTCITKTGGGDRGARLTVAEGVVLHEASVGETTNECRGNDRGGGVAARELAPEA